MANPNHLRHEGITQGSELDHRMFLTRKAEDKRKRIAADQERAAELRAKAEATPDRTFAQQIEALRKVTNRQIAVLELHEQAGGMLKQEHFKILQSLAFVVRSLAAEARAQAVGWDPARASDDELARAVEGSD